MDKSVVFYLMRLISAALCSALLATAFCAASRSRSPLALLGVAVAVTPMVIYLAGVVNPGGFEISAAVCVFCTGFTVFGNPHLRRSRFLLGWLALSSGILVQTRGLSPLFLAISLATLLALFGFKPLRDALRSDVGKAGAAFVGACSVFALVWFGLVNSLDVMTQSGGPSPARGIPLLVDSFQHFFSIVPQMIGVFGDVDTPSPVFVFAIWYAALVLVVGVGLTRGKARSLGILVAITAVGVGLPVLVTALEAPRLGFIGQGRDWLPLEVLLPMVAAYAAGQTTNTRPGNAPLAARHISEAQRRLLIPGAVVTAIAGLGIAQVAALVELLHRYRNGLGHPLNFFGPAPWNPPVPAAALIAVAVVLTALACTWLARSTLHRLLAEPSPVG